ncbi:prion-inhibition and propagation-domain-containing protein [Phaeosphaeria sp. MPI-PUGE-AT-0046c]|nr:prion-inhibition and propagation-domain-containing protein [Phaeosphaeria sp. MPI-PUGE-AT-0046c]
MVGDPLSVAGVALGGTSLLFQVFDGAVKGFNFIVAAVDMPVACEKYREWLIIEYNRILAWGEAVKLIDGDTGERIIVSLGADPLEIITIVSRVDTLLRNFVDLNNRYAELRPDEWVTDDARDKARDKVSHEDVLKTVSSLALSYEKTRQKREHLLGTNHMRAAFRGLLDVAKNPKRIRWVLRDESVFTALLEDLRYQTTRLHELVDDRTSNKILDVVSKTQLEMIQMRKTSEALQHLIMASHLFAKYDDKSSIGDRSRSDVLRSLVQLKCLTLPIDKLSKEDMAECRFVDFADLAPIGAKEDGRSTAELVIGAQKIPVWIEWKLYELELPSDEDENAQPRIHPATELRTAAMTRMLQMEKPSDFCTPPCYGYFDDWERSKTAYRFGWIFALPVSEPNVVSLYTLLSNAEKGPKVPKPSLNTRILMAKKFATSILYLHGVDWLHKGIRSANVLFPYGQSLPDLESPQLSGFEYSRPDASNQTTEGDEPGLEVDMYRWPTIQSQITHRSRKIHDIYALGLLLLEVFMWKPLHRILDFDLKELGFDQVRDVRQMLLKDKPEILSKLRQKVGYKIHDLIRRCIQAEGEEGFMVSEEEEKEGEHSGIVGLKLQEAFMERAIDVLQDLNV